MDQKIFFQIASRNIGSMSMKVDKEHGLEGSDVAQ
jgi:hypothetical protein